MTVITEAELREMWQSGKGSIAILPQGTKLTPSAKDFIKDWRLEIAFEGGHKSPDSIEAKKAKPAPSEKSVIARPKQAPRLLLNGRPAIPTPIMRAQNKNQPRLILKGQPVLTALLNLESDNGAKPLQLAKIDTLTAQFLLATAQARRFNLPDLGNALAQLAAFTHAIAEAGRGEKAMPMLENESLFNLPDFDEAKSSPVPDTHEMLLHLNLLRAQTNEIRLSAQNAHCAGVFISALDRLVDAVNRLLLQFKAGKFPWTVSGWQK